MHRILPAIPVTSPRPKSPPPPPPLPRPVPSRVQQHRHTLTPFPHPLTPTCSRTASRVSNTRTMAPMLRAQPMAARPATPPPITSTCASSSRARQQARADDVSEGDM